MCVNRDRSDTRDAEVEATGLGEWGGEAGAGEVRHKEGAEAAVDVEGNFIRGGEAREGRNFIDDAVGIIRGGANQEYCIGIYEAADFRNGDAVGRSRTCDGVKLDFEIGCCFIECCVRGLRYDPGGLSVTRSGWTSIVHTSLARSHFAQRKLSAALIDKP